MLQNILFYFCEQNATYENVNAEKKVWKNRLMMNSEEGYEFREIGD